MQCLSVYPTQCPSSVATWSHWYSKSKLKKQRSRIDSLGVKLVLPLSLNSSVLGVASHSLPLDSVQMVLVDMASQVMVVASKQAMSKVQEMMAWLDHRAIFYV